ncbi:hypothetical protein [Desulfonatronovibrio magnus]|uniref:hypothetical protein n=1 Tax=Desulfonatronovibrio magnus TaxID=698827 RepID=UPI0005EB6055|nr:hypothetical protein [Desulfonatronovibrio magnus]
MKILDAKEVDIKIPFDLEIFMGLAQVRGLEGRETAEMIEYWNRWRPDLKIFTLGRKRGYILVYMGRDVEDELEALWDQSPSKGFKLQALVQTMIIGVLRELLPEIKENQCAPVPKPGTVLTKSLRKIGLELYEDGAMNYKYSTLTFYPYRDGCEICYLKSSCPKINLPEMAGLFKAGE